MRECEDEQVRAVPSGAGKHKVEDVKLMRDNLRIDSKAFDALIDACHPPIMALQPAKIS